MEFYDLKGDIDFIGFSVKKFPEGIPAAFEKLNKIVAKGKPRAIYSKSQPNGNGIHYVVGMESLSPSEAAQFGFESYTIPKGKYITITVLDWPSKLHTIQGIFDELTQYPAIDPQGFCVEWYKNENELVCMVNLAK